MPMHNWSRISAGVFHDFHVSWIATIRDALNHGLLPKSYYAMAEQVAEGPIPDVVALERPDIPPHIFQDSTGIALAEHPPRVSFTLEAEEESYSTKANHIAVYCSTGDRVVAYVEVVSSGNKHSEANCRKFVAKLTDALRSGCNLLVIDPYPPTRRDPEGLHARLWNEWFDGAQTPKVTNEKPLGLMAYRADLVPTAYFEPFGVGQTLIDMPLFLDPDYYVNVPLERTYQEAYRRVPERWREVVEAAN